MRSSCALFLSSLLFLSATTTPSSAADGDDELRVGLVLSGGGARGAAHIGVIQVLEEEGLVVDYVVGTSMGAIVGGIYASGRDGEQLADGFRAVDWRRALDDTPARRQRTFRRKQEDATYIRGLELGVDSDGVVLPRSLRAGQRFEFEMRKLLGIEAPSVHFDALPTPFRAVATDLVTGDAVVLSDGDLVQALRASAAVPGAFPPVERDGQLLADGGLADNLPVDVARSMGADVVIAVNVGTAPLPREEIEDAVDIAAQMILLLTERNVQDSVRSLRDDDLLIQVDLGDFSAADFARIPDIIDRGRTAAEPLRPRIRELVARLGERSPRQVPDVPAPPVVAKIEVQGLERVAESQVRARIEVPLGEPLDADTVRRDVDRIYGIGDFEQVSYVLDETEEGTVLRYRVREKSWGPNYLRAGVRVEFEGSGVEEIQLLASLRRSQMNELGGEFRVQAALGPQQSIAAEFDQPLIPSGQFFVAPEFSFQNLSINIYDGNRRIAEIRHRRTLATFDVGWRPKTYGEMRAGLEFGEDSISPRIGSTFPERHERIGRFVLDATVDRLDDGYLPSDGVRIGISAIAQEGSLGADLTFRRAQLEAQGAWPVGERGAMVADLNLGTSFGGGLPLQDQFMLGGLGRLSGFSTGTLRGDYMAMARLVYHRRLGDIGWLAGTRWGVSLESGNVWMRSSDIAASSLHHAVALFIAAESPLGTLFMGLGHGQGGQDSLSLVIGRPF